MFSQMAPIAVMPLLEKVLTAPLMAYLKITYVLKSHSPQRVWGYSQGA